MIWNPIERLLWGVVICFTFISAIFFYNRGRHLKENNEKYFFYAFAGFLLGLALARIPLYLSDFLVPGELIDFNFYGDYGEADTIFWRISYLYRIFNCIGFTILIYFTERIIRRTYFILTIIGVIIIVLITIDSITFNITIASFLYSLINLILGVWLIISLYYFGKWSHLEYKAISAMLLLGAALVLSGWNMGSMSLKYFNFLPLIFSPLLFGLGVLFIIIPIFMNPNIFSQSKYFWYVIGGIATGILLLLEYFHILVEMNMLTIISTGLYIVLCVPIVLYMSKNIELEKQGKFKRSKTTEHVDVLSMFSKPTSLTEEEVSISKEKQICLVCKNKLEKQIFLCSSCGAFYCMKCCDTLTTLENACWVCEAPFDTTKPIKLKKEEDKGISIDVEPHKKGGLK